MATKKESGRYVWWRTEAKASGGPKLTANLRCRFFVAMLTLKSEVCVIALPCSRNAVDSKPGDNRLKVNLVTRFLDIQTLWMLLE